MKYWFVNLGKYYKEQRNGSFLWAPVYNKQGKKVYHWETMKYVDKGDIIFCNNDAKIVSIGVAKSSCYFSDIPSSFNGSWRTKGRKLDIEFIDLNIPFKYTNFREYILENINPKENPFDKSGKAKQGYLFKLDEKIAEYIIRKINNNISNKIDSTKNDIIEEDIIIKEEHEQFEKINRGIISGYNEQELDNIENKEYNYDEENKNTKSKNYRCNTDSKLKATRLEKANYLCEVDNNHKTFINASGKNQYMECHHIIPMKAQKYIKKIKLDSMFNLISICPMCHAKVHYANEKEKRELFAKIYKIRENEMLNKGFNIEQLEEIFNKYYM